MTQAPVVGEAEAPAASPTPVARERRRKQWADNGWGYLFIGPQLIGLLVFALGPLIFAFALGFMKWDGLGEREFVGMENFGELFKDPSFGAAVKNTAYFTLLCVPGELVCALLVALALHRTRGKSFYRFFYFLPVVTSSVAVSVVWLWLLNGEYGPINTYLQSLTGMTPPNWLADAGFVIPALALVSIWRGLGYTMVIFIAGLEGVPQTYLEAARVDGAGPVRSFFHVTLPLLSPTILFLMVTSVIGSFQVFDIAFIMTGGGPGDASRTIVFHLYELAFVEFKFGESSAAAVLLFLGLLMLTLVQLAGQRRFVHYEE